MDGLVTHVSKPPTQPQHHQTMRGDGLHPAQLFETKDSSREWRVFASSETECPLSAGGSRQTKPVPRGCVYLLVTRNLKSTAELGVSLPKPKTLWNTMGIISITECFKYYVSFMQLQNLFYTSFYMWAWRERENGWGCRSC